MSKKLSAKTADKYALYQRAVQSADQDVNFLFLRTGQNSAMILLPNLTT